MPKPHYEIFNPKESVAAKTVQQQLIQAIKSMRKEIQTNKLTDLGDGGIFETLKDAGFEQGDFLPLYNFNPNAVRTIGFTSTTYAGDTAFSLVKCIWNNLFPTDVITHVYGSVHLSGVGTDETVSLRIYNGIDDETIGESTGITTTGLKTIEADYEPTTLNPQMWLRWEWKESNGVNSSNLADALITLGVVL